MRPFIFRPSSPAISLSVVILITLFWTLWALCAHAQSITNRLTGSPKVPWQITADAVTYDAEATTYNAKGNVVIEKQATRLVADSVSFNHKAMTASAAGHVMMTVGEDILIGERLELDLDQETGVIHGGSVFLNENHFYIRGERIEKTGKDTYRAEQASITSCDGDRPDWILSGRTLKVTIEGYGTADHAFFRVRDAPVLYTPYIVFPVKTKRQTGLLKPKVSVSSRWGFSWDQPLFWAISDDTDATLYTQYMQKRGTKVGLEYRYALTDASYGAVMADGLQDRQIDDGTPEATRKWGYDGDAWDRPNTDRYWLRGKIDQELPWDAKARLDLDIVSDQDYLTEFKDGLSGFNESRDYFRRVFGRDIDTYDENTRTNRLNINRTWSHYSLNGDLRWNDNVTKRRWEDTNDTLQQLPVIQFDGVKQQAFDTDVYWTLDSEYTYLYREDGPRGHRTDLYPRAYLPLKWKNYLSVEPSVGWRHTTWVMDRWEDESLDRSTHRQIYDARLDLSTEFSKIMGSPVKTVDRIRHRVKPRVVYEYIPDQDQSELPFFSDRDRLDGQNRVIYSLTNTFTARTAKAAPRATLSADDGAVALAGNGLPDRGQTDLSAGNAFGYRRFCRFYLEQSYDIAAARENLPEPFSDIYGELEFNPGQYLSINANANFDTYESNFPSHNIGSTIANRRGDRLRITHSYEKDAYKTVYGSLSVKLTHRLTARGEIERNLQDKRNIRKGAGFLYTAQCWSVDFFYSVEGEDNKFTLLVNLMGIGGFGK